MEGEAIIQDDIGYFMNTTHDLASGVFRFGKQKRLTKFPAVPYRVHGD